MWEKNSKKRSDVSIYKDMQLISVFECNFAFKSAAALD